MNNQFIPLYIEFLASVLGLFSNGLALVVIHNVKRLRNSFGILCSFLVVCNFTVLIIKMGWLLLPYSRVNPESSKLSKVVGEITLVLWYFPMKIHLAIAVDRFLSIVYPSRIGAQKSSLTVAFWAMILFMVSILQTTMIHLYPGAYFTFDAAEHSWNYRGSAWAATYAIFFDYYTCVFEMSSVFVLDCITLSKLRKFINQNSDESIARDKRREGRLLVQVSILQTAPYMLLLIVYFEIAPRLSSQFGVFLATMIAWQSCTIFDGLFIVIFHAKKLFRGRFMNRDAER